LDKDTWSFSFPGRLASLPSLDRIIRKLDPDRRVVARFFPPSHGTIDAGGLETRGDGRAQEQVVDSQSGVARVGVSEIVPEGVDALARVKRAQGVGPTLRDELAKSFADLDAEQRVVDPSLWFVDVEFGRHHVIIAGEHDRRAAREKLGAMRDQPLKPTQLEVEFLASKRIAVRQVQAADQQAVDRRLDVSAMQVVLVARESASGLDQRLAAG
jgi:hypothetical protein